MNVVFLFERIETFDCQTNSVTETIKRHLLVLNSLKQVCKKGTDLSDLLIISLNIG